jgi:tRNA(Arg) A34 adenosine deaminase TadA
MPYDPHGLILIADDDEISRSTLARAIEADGFDVMQAIDGGSAHKVLDEHDVALAIVDHMMHPKGGLDFARKAGIDTPRLPMVMVTDEITSDLLNEVNNLGFAQYFEKPVDPQRITRQIRRTIKSNDPRARAALAHQTRSDRKYTPDQLMRHAIKLGQRNAERAYGGPFGAVVADAQGAILGEGTNGRTARFDPIAHAEVMAIRQACQRLSQTHLQGCVLYSSSEPTALAQALIVSVELDTVYYGLTHDEVRQLRGPASGTDDSGDANVSGELASPREQRSANYVRLCADEAAEMLRNV